MLLFIQVVVGCLLSAEGVAQVKHLGLKKKSVESTIAKFTITGFAHDFADSTWLFLDDANRLGVAIDSILVINERFSFMVSKIPQVKLKQYAIRTSSFSEYKIFWTENRDLIFSSVRGNFRTAMINGSVFQQKIEEFDRLTMPLIKEIDSLRRNFGTTDSIVWKRILDLERQLKNVSVQFVADNASSTISAYLLSIYCKQWGPKISSEQYKKISPENKRTAFGLAVKKFVELNKEIEVGSLYEDFEQNSFEGVPLRLSSYIGKYILLEFWASWCGPCRRENPNLVKLYTKYKDRGFEIFGVSHDISEAAWKKAVATDNLKWPNVCDLKGGDNEAALVYGIFEIPTNFLIDPSGRIIAKNLRGKELEEILRQLFNE